MTAQSGPSKYRRKPTVVDAMQYEGTDQSAKEINHWAQAYLVDYKRDESRSVQLWVEANQAWVNLTSGEWVLKDAAGYYPCRPEIFDATYEVVE